MFYSQGVQASLLSEDLLSHALGKVIATSLPKKIKKVALSDGTKNSVKEILGEPGLVTGSVFYYEIKGYKYALIIKFNENKIDSLTYKPHKSTISLNDFRKDISIKELQTDEASSSHFSGRTILFNKKDLRFKVWFKNTSKKTIDRMEFFR